MKKRSDKGFVYLWALFAVTAAGIVLAATGQVWQIKMKREKELELLFIGDQYRKAIMSYYNSQVAGVREYPESLEELLEDKRGPATVRHLRKIYIDPMTMEDKWGVVEEEAVPQQAQSQNNSAGNANPASPASNTLGGSQISSRKGITGVYSLSEQQPLKKDNFPDHFAKFTEAETYQDWQFVFSRDAGGENKANQQNQSGSAGTSSSPFGASSGTGTSGGGTTSSASPFAPPAGGQTGQNPFAR
ncbi:hypothetical protein SAMN05216326_11289 [Nitrosomonas marina]|uniref:Type II secretory pathway, pseudopilin PulG n=1 Tax=Nitrosomonas marina TaxID=917 RepID=A0A1I0C1A5_9PROT|nr:type II secretion system protein [Nitrosomonas marina]SET12533.1 hypothetical protein SAMN05216326_11289 [Nitrosomonas marina]